MLTIALLLCVLTVTIILIQTKDSPDLSITPTNTPVTPPIEIPVRTLSSDDLHILDVEKFDFTPINFENDMLSTISGSFDEDSPDVDNVKASEKVDNDDKSKSRPQSSTNELPLTQLNLALFTSKMENKNKNSCIMSTNELPLSDIRFPRSGTLSKQMTIDSQNDDMSMEVNWETDIQEMDETSGKVKELSTSRHRSFSDPNILDSEWINYSNKNFLLKKYNDSLIHEQLSNSSQLTPPTDNPCVPYSFYPEHAPDATCVLCTNRRSPSTLLSFFTSSSPRRPPGASRSLSHPSPPCMSCSDCGQTVKRHRHGIAGQMSYFKMLGFGCGGPLGLKKLIGGSANSLFSTAVISGSSSAPNLRDMITNSSSATAIEGFGGVPPIRPLETLHNALSLKQLDTFLDRMTTAPLFRTPSSTPPKYPSTPLPTPNNEPNLPVSLPITKSRPLKLQSPSNSVGWSGPPSLLSSSGQSSPGYSESNSKGSSSEMSSSIISGDGLTVDTFAKIFPTAPGLDQDLGSVGMLLDSCDKDSDSIEFSDYYSNISKPQGISGDVTPVSVGSEMDYNTLDATAGSTSADQDITVTEDIEMLHPIGEEAIDNNDTLTSERLTALFNSSTTTLSNIENNSSQASSGDTPKLVSPLNNVSVCTNVLHSPTESYNLKHVENTERVQPSTSKEFNEFDKTELKNIAKHMNAYEKNIPNFSINLTRSGSDKWSTSKEKFLEGLCITKVESIDSKNINTNMEKKVEKENELTKIKPGTVVIKESFIEPPRISRVSKSFHGKSPAGNSSGSSLSITAAQRRASDGPVPDRNLNTQDIHRTNSEKVKSSKRPQFLTQKSHPVGGSSKSTSNPVEGSVRSQRFTTTRVDEAEHAASVGIPFSTRLANDIQDASTREENLAGHVDEQCNSSADDSSINNTSENIQVTKSSKENSSVTLGFHVQK